MGYFRMRMRGRRSLLVSAVIAVVVLGGGAGAYATVVGYPTDSVTVMTGCLTKNGTGAGNIVNIAASSTPIKPCGANQTLVHLSGGTITRVTAGTGLTKTGSLGTGGTGYVDNGFATLGLQDSYALPQNCTSGQIPDWGGTTWSCADDQNTTYDGTDFATSGQDCPAHQFATGIDSGGNLKCAQPTLDDLKGSACTIGIGSHHSTIEVSVDNTTGAVSITCSPPTQSQLDCELYGGTYSNGPFPPQNTGAIWTCNGWNGVDELDWSNKRNVLSGDCTADGGNTFESTHVLFGANGSTCRKL